jgi:hypothetical protein
MERETHEMTRTRRKDLAAFVVFREFRAPKVLRAQSSTLSVCARNNGKRNGRRSICFKRCCRNRLRRGGVVPPYVPRVAQHTGRAKRDPVPTIRSAITIPHCIETIRPQSTAV